MRIVTRLLASLLLLFVACGAQAQPDCPPAAPKLDTLAAGALRGDVRDRGFLWRLTRDGRTSWLYGTVHVSKPEWLLPGPRVRAAFAQAQVVALELDPADPELMRLFAQPGDVARKQRVTAGLGPRIAQVAARECVPAAGLATLQPMLQVSTLSLSEARREGFHPEFAIDAMLWGLAQRTGKKFVALETPASQVAALTPGSEADERALLVQGLDEIESGSDRTSLQRLLQAWATNDEHALATYLDWCECLTTPEERRYLQRVNDARNAPMADKLAALQARGESFFAAVGSLHMTGPQALQRLLQARGFTVESVPLTGATP